MVRLFASPRTKYTNNRKIIVTLEKRITFLTSSMGTKWLAYSQALLKIWFPECKRIVVDGSSGWDPLFFVSLSESVETEYQVLVDEDCFILDREKLLKLIKIMDENQDVAIMATPDGGTFHRDFNPIACNLFFAIIRQKALRKAIYNKEWQNLVYSDVEHMANKDHVEKLDESRISYSRKEPYYPFFWAVIASGGSIKYIIPGVEKNLLASEVKIDGFSQPLLIHMWWLRCWFSPELDSYLKVSNLERYRRLEREVLAPLFRRFRPRMFLLAEECRRVRRRALRHIARTLAAAKSGKSHPFSDAT